MRGLKSEADMRAWRRKIDASLSVSSMAEAFRRLGQRIAHHLE